MLSDEIRERIRLLVAEWPPLNDEQRAVIRRVFAESPAPAADQPRADAA